MIRLKSTTRLNVTLFLLLTGTTATANKSEPSVAELTTKYNSFINEIKTEMPTAICERFKHVPNFMVINATYKVSDSLCLKNITQAINQCIDQYGFGAAMMINKKMTDTYSQLIGSCVTKKYLSQYKPLTLNNYYQIVCTDFKHRLPTSKCLELLNSPNNTCAVNAFGKEMTTLTARQLATDKGVNYFKCIGTKIMDHARV